MQRNDEFVNTAMDGGNPLLRGLPDEYRCLISRIAYIGPVGSYWLSPLFLSLLIPLFCMLFLVSVFALGLSDLLTGPIATESDPAGLVASAAELVSGVGEISGGWVVSGDYWLHCLALWSGQYP
jgi:hypothetical protein